MCGDVGGGVWLHAGGIAEANITPVIGQFILDVRILDRVVFRDRPRVFYTRIAALGLPCASCRSALGVVRERQWPRLCGQ